MPLPQEMLDFIGKVTGKAVDARKYEEQVREKSNAIAEVVEGGLDGPARDDLRKAMKFVMKTKSGKEIESISEKGQEHEIDSGDTSNLQGLDPNLQPQIQAAMDKVVKMRDDLRAKKGKDGENLFSEPEIAEELFTRLHREGLMPENLIIDEYSATAKLLGASMKAYKTMLEEIQAEREKAKAKQRVDLHGGGNKRDMLKAIAGELSDLKDSALDATAGKLFAAIKLGETEEDRKRMFDLTKKSVMAGMKVESAVTAGMFLEKTIDHTVPKRPDPRLLVNNLVQATAKNYENQDQAEAVSRLLAGHLTELITVADNAFKANANEALAVGEFLKGLLKTNEGVLSKDVISGTPGIVSGGIANVLDGLSLGKIEKVYEDAARMTKVQQASASIVLFIDQALSAAVGKINPIAGPLLQGAYDRAVDSGAIADMATADEPDSKGIIDALADGFVDCLTACNPEPKGTTFVRVGEQMSKAFKGGVTASALTLAIQQKPADPFAQVRTAATAAVAKAMGLPGPDGKTEPGDDPTSADLMKQALKDPATADKVRSSLADSQASELSKEWEASAEEQEEYERMLVLIDEGGDFMAEQRSIENLIAKLDADRKTLELVASVGGELSGICGVLGTVATDSAKLASEAAGQAALHFTGPIGAAIRSAQLIVQLSVNAIKAAERWELYNKFKFKVEKTKRARSALLPVIQNFYENKQEQVTYHTIEDAMLAIQLAGSLVECVPNEIAMATGKLITAAGKAGQAVNDAAYAGYNEVQLRKAWATTRAAINNPASRNVGLAALHQNPTLAMHALAWASTNGDRMARSILSDAGVNEQTLAHHQGDSGTEKKIVQLLETLLDEDRQLKDVEKIKVNWFPSTVELTRESWMISTNRARTKANPPLGPIKTDKIESALKFVQSQPDPDALRSQLEKTQTSAIIQYQKQVDALIAELEKYEPKVADMSPHEEMALLTERYTALAKQRRLALAQVRDEKLALAKVSIGQRTRRPANATL